MCYQVLIGSPIFSKQFRIFQNIFFSIEIKLKLKSTLWFDFCFVPKLIWSWNKTSTQTFHKITYNIIIFLYISKVLALLEYILSLAWTFSIKRKFLFQKLNNTENQNNSVLNSYKRICRHKNCKVEREKNCLLSQIVKRKGSNCKSAICTYDQSVQTVIVYIPVLFLLLSSPLEIYFMKISRRR